MTTIATHTFFARVTWGNSLKEWTFSCDDVMMNQIRTAMLEGRSVSIVTPEMETIINTTHVAKLEFQQSPG